MRIKVAVVVSALVFACALVPSAARASSPNANGSSQANGNGHEDPCAHALKVPGKALGLDKQCVDVGSSNGVARGDFDGDGFADLAIGEPGAPIHGAANAGDVIVLRGSASGITGVGKQLWYLGPERNMPSSPEAGDRFGSALASGDFNADGFSDLAIGIPGKATPRQVVNGTSQPFAGAVAIIYGSASGLNATDPSKPAPQYFDTNLFYAFNCTNLQTLFKCNLTTRPSTDASYQLGHALSWGDFNNDGIGDLAVGIPGFRRPGDSGTFPATGLVWVIGGRSTTGLDPRIWGPPPNFTQLNNVSYVVWDTIGLNSASGFGGNNGDLYGATLAARGNSLVIGAPGATVGTFDATRSGVCVANCLAGAGVVDTVTDTKQTIFGGLGGFNTPRQRLTLNTFPGNAAHAGDHFGVAIASGDFDGDHADDIAISDLQDVNAFTNAGRVVVLSTSAAMSIQNFSLDALPASRSEAGAGFGLALASGDFNADGKEDLAIGVPFKDVSVTQFGVTRSLQDAGEVAVLYGSLGGLQTSGAQVFNQDTLNPGSGQANATFGRALTPWNFGRDERGALNLPVKIPDLAIGAPDTAVAGLSDAGEVSVVYGSQSAGRLQATAAGNPQQITADNIGFGSAANALFGGAVY